jgi:hypothetical protein
MCSPVTLNDLRILPAENAKYLKLHFDCRLNRKKHILCKQKQLGFQLGKIYWLSHSKLQLSTKNKKVAIIQDNFQTYLGLLVPIVASNYGAQPPI